MKILAICILLLTFISGIAVAETSTIRVKQKSVFAKYANTSAFPTFPMSASNASTGETLVVWQADSQDLPRPGCGDGITSWGRIMGPLGNSTATLIPTVLPDTESGAAIAYNPTTKEFLLVFGRINWSGCDQNFAINGFSLNSQMKTIGQEFEIIPSTATTQNVHPNMIFNPHTNGYTLIWEITGKSGSGTPDSGLTAVQLDQTGNITGNRVTMAKNPGGNKFYDNFCCGRVLDFAELPSGKKFAILFQQRSQVNQVDYWLATMDLTLKSVTRSKFGSYVIPDAASNLNFVKRGAA